VRQPGSLAGSHALRAVACLRLVFARLNSASSECDAILPSRATSPNLSLAAGRAHTLQINVAAFEWLTTSTTNAGGYVLAKSPQTKSFTCHIKYGIHITYMAKPLNTQRAAKAAGIAVMTLHRWMVAKRLKAPALRIRNGRAVRLWHQADLDRLLALKQRIYCKDRGRKKGYKRK
jgi:hypothetical protein